MKNSVLKNISFLIVMFILLTFFPFESVKTGAYNTLKYGIDVSSHQGNIDWISVSMANIDFAVIRTGTTDFNKEIMKTDSYFAQNYSGAKSNGIKTGVYYFTSAYTHEGMIQNAYDCLNTLDGRTLDYPIFIDIENDAKSTMQVSLGKSILTDYLLDALKVLSDAGYKAGVYSNKSFLESYVDAERIKNAGFYIWMAQYPFGSYAIDPVNYDKSNLCSMWQYSDRGSVSGITGNCDVDVCYTDFEPVPEPDGEKYIVATESSNLNIRSEASIDGSIIGKAPKDAVVTVMQITDDGNWAKVYYNGIIGYCSMQYLKKIISEPEEPVVPIEPEVPEKPEDTEMLMVTTKEVNLNMYSEPDKTIVFVYQNLPDSVKSVNMAYSIIIDGIVDLTWGNWNANTLPLNISGKSHGETDITVFLKNLDTDEVLESVTIHVIVKNTSNEPEDNQMLLVTTKEVNLNMYSESDKTIVFVYQNLPDSIKAVNMAYSTSMDDIVDLTWGNWNANTLPLNISGKNHGETDITVFLKNMDTDEVIETVTIHVAVKDIDILPLSISKSYENHEDILSDVRLSINNYDEITSGYIVVDKTSSFGTISCNVKEDSIVKIEVMEGYYLNSDKKFFKLNFYPQKTGKEKIAFNYMVNGSVVSTAYIDFEVYEDDEIKGDANKDGKVTIADAVMLQQWLLGTGELTCPTNVDLCKDGIINIFDMIEMRKILIDIGSQSAQ